MLKKVLPLIILALAIPVFATPESDAKKVIETQMQKAMDAYKKRDVKPYTALLAPEFKATDTHGVVRDRKELTAALLEQVTKAVRIQTATYKVNSLKIRGGQAVVHSTTAIVAVYPADGKKTMLVDRTGTIESVWAKKAGKWLMVTSKALTNKLIVDGKEIKN